MAQAARESDRLLRTGEAARLLGTSEATVRNLAKAGRLEYEDTPLGKLFPLRAVEQLREERKAA